MISSSVISKFSYSILNANIRFFPFPHFSTKDIFSEEFYSELLRNMPPDDAFESITETNRLGNGNNNDVFKPSENRLITYLNQDCVLSFPAAIKSFWTDVSEFLNGPDFRNIILQKFDPFLRGRYPNESNVNFYTRIQLIRDFTDFSIGPHSDHFKKVVVLLLYLPENADHVESGTSIYTPKDINFTCEGGPHYESENFNKVFTAPYLPNTALGFFKTNNSFHGVEPVSKVNLKTGRNLIQCSIIEA